MEGERTDGRMARQAKQLRRLQSPHHRPQPLPWFLAAPGREGGSRTPTSGWVWGDRTVKPWSLALLHSPLRLTGFAAPDLHSRVY